MSDTTTLTDLIRRFKAGDRQAADRLFTHYAQDLTRVAEQHLSARLAGREDGADVVQSALRTFFRRNREGQFQIASSAELWRLLVKITVLKACAKGRHHTAAMRDVRAEVAQGDDAWLAYAVAKEPGPEEAVALVDQIEVLLRGLPPEYARILEMLLQEHPKTEIAKTLGISRTSVHRAAVLLRERLESSLSS
jgi:DNA-directed RNA polymerase specialized sigma24 family protein